MASSDENDVGVWSKTTPLHYVAQVIRKLYDGTYPVEATQCFCGGKPADSVIVERDRYTIPHRMVMCENCLLMRANPRMTREAYKRFYNDEYRKIYDGFPYGAQSEDNGFLFDLQVTKGREIVEFLRTLDVVPRSVIDIGSDKGGTLLPFKDAGATVYGVEWCERGRRYAENKGIACVYDIDDLIQRGVKADLVIMQDIIEHFMDLNEMAKIHEVMNPNGVIFLYTPGFLASSPYQYFQNAHTFQFIGATLEFVMNRLGYVAELLDDRIVSVWKYIGDVAYPEPPPVEWRKFIMEHLRQQEERSLPPVRTRCKFSEKEMLTNLDANLKQKWPSVADLKDKYSGPAIILGGGPSVDGQIDKIKELVASGHSLFAIERMYPWCVQHGLTPDFVVQLDASDDVGDGFTHIQPSTKHLIAATTYPKLLETLKGHKVYLFSGAGGTSPDSRKVWAENGYKHVLIINTGGTVVLGSMFLALVLGFRNIHLFGFDCMTDGINEYATGIAGKSVDRSYMAVEVGDAREKVLTCTSFLSFAQQFFHMVETARRWGMIESVDVYGESLINKMWERPTTEEKWQTSSVETPSKSILPQMYLQ